MRFYEVTSDDYEEGCQFYGTKAQAVSDAKAIVGGGGGATVDRVELTITRAGIIALANQRGWCRSREAIWPKGAM